MQCCLGCIVVTPYHTESLFWIHYKYFKVSNTAYLATPFSRPYILPTKRQETKDIYSHKATKSHSLLRLSATIDQTSSSYICITSRDLFLFSISPSWSTCEYSSVEICTKPLRASSDQAHPYYRCRLYCCPFPLYQCHVCFLLVGIANFSSFLFPLSSCFPWLPPLLWLFSLLLSFSSLSSHFLASHGRGWSLRLGLWSSWVGCVR